LFVAVSIAPERVFGTEAEAVRQAQALSAFTALANVFFISMASLVPTIQIGIVVVIAAIPSTLRPSPCSRWSSTGAGSELSTAVQFCSSAAR